MPQSSQFAHRNVSSTALPYKSNISPSDTEPCFVSGSGDILTTIAGYAQRRPGFSLTVEPSPTSFISLRRLFSWDRFDGTFIEMACQVNSSNQSVVYKRIVGTDNSFVSIFTDTGSANVFDFVVSNNTVYFSNGNVAKAWEPVNGIRNWGIASGSVNSSVGPNLTGTATDTGSGGTAWTNPSNITGDVSYATSTGTTNFINATNFGFSVPPNNAILGIQVSWRDNYTVSGFTDLPVLEGFTAQLIIGGVVVGTGKSGTGLGGATINTIGGSSDLWGTTATAANVNASNFGVQFSFFPTNSSPPAPRDGTLNEAFRDVTITIFNAGGPPVVVSGSAGNLSATIGFQYVFCYGNSKSGHISSPSPVSNSTGSFGGFISTSALAAGGSGYAANDTGIVSAGNFNAKYTVNTVTGGAVTTYTISAAGTGYVVANDVPTAVGGTQPGVGSGFTINITAITGALNVSISLTASTDPQVNQIRLFRSTDSVAQGVVAGTFFEIPTSPYPNTTQAVLDTAQDINLNIFSIAPFPGFNDPPTPGQQAVYYSGRIWLFKNNQVVFSGLEEIINGVPEESFPSGPAGNFWKFDQPVNGLAVAGTGLSQTLAIFCGGRIYAIAGSSLDTFRRFLVTNRRGCRNENTVTSLGGMIAWLDSSSTIWVTDGQSLQEVSLDIRPDLASQNPLTATFTFHVSGNYHWLVCAFTTQIFVYDLDLGQWMPPWNFAAKTVYSGETSPGVYQLMASNGIKALILNQSNTAGSFNDNSLTYQPIMKTNNFAVVPDFGKRFSYGALSLYDEPSRTGAGWFFQGDSNSATTFSDLSLLIDDDPLNAGSIYTSIVQNKITPQVAWNRNQGTFLVQNIFSMNGPVGRWYSVQMKLQNSDTLDKIYDYFLVYTQRK